MSKVSFKKGDFIACHLEWKGRRKTFVRGMAMENGWTGTAAKFSVLFGSQVIAIPGNAIYMVSRSPILAPQSKDNEPEAANHQDRRQGEQGH